MSEALGIDPASGGYRDVSGRELAEPRVPAEEPRRRSLPVHTQSFLPGLLPHGRMDAILPHAAAALIFEEQALGRPRKLPLRRPLSAEYPPAMFFSMQRDDKQRGLIELNQEIIRTEKHAPAEIIKVGGLGWGKQCLQLLL